MKKIAHIYNKLEEYLLVSSLVFTVCILFYQVIMRFVFNNTPSWTEEVARYLFIWQIWMGTSVALREGKHVRVELITNAFIRRNQPLRKNILEMLILLIWIGFAVFLTVNGFLLVNELAGRNAVSAGMRIPLKFVCAAVPVSCSVVTLRLAHLIVLEFRKLLRGGAA